MGHYTMGEEMGWPHAFCKAYSKKGGFKGLKISL